MQNNYCMLVQSFDSNHAVWTWSEDTQFGALVLKNSKEGNAPFCKVVFEERNTHQTVTLVAGRTLGPRGGLTKFCVSINGLPLQQYALQSNVFDKKGDAYWQARAYVLRHPEKFGTNPHFEYL